MKRTPSLLAASAALIIIPAIAQAQPTDPTFGMEFEFAGNGNRIVLFENMPFENYKALMKVIVDHYGGRASDIRKITFTKPASNLERYPSGERELFKAEWTDPRGRSWRIEPEFVASSGYDGYELVTPPMEDANELKEVLTKVRGSGLVREGRRSGVHLTVDGNSLVGPRGDARALTNLILMHENNLPMLRRMFNPVRGGGHANYFARDLGVDHLDMLEEIDRLPERERTHERLSEIFRSREGRERMLHEVDPMDPTTEVKPWKYRSMNLAKMLNVNPLHDGEARLVEFRMFDLADPETHRLEAELYRKMVTRAKEMAENGDRVRLTRTATPEGADPAEANLPANPEEARAKAREMIEGLGLDPREYETLLESNFNPREVRSEREFRGVLDRLPTDRITHNGKAFTYGFEFEGRGEEVVNLMIPTEREVADRWRSMSDAEKKAYYRNKVGTDHSSVDSYFEPDVERHKWLDPYWYTEGTGNWELHSRVMENLGEATDAMREAKALAGKAGKGFHLHMRDNAPDWDKLERSGSEYADFIERASNWIYLKRVERLRTDLSLKTWSNARLSPSDIANVAELGESDRATLRVAEVSRGGWGDGEYIDLEIRGLTKYVDDVETLAKIMANNMKTGEFGTWKHTDNVMETGGNSWGYGSSSVPESLSYIKNFENYMRTVEGEELTPERRKIIEGLQDSFARRASGDMRAYATGVATPLLPWEKETALSEADRRAAKFAKEEYLGWLKRYSDRIMAGEFGVDLSLASEEAFVEKLGLSPEDAKALVNYRRANGKLTPESAARVLALRGGSPADVDKISRAEKLDLNTVGTEGLRGRLGLSAADSKRLLDYRAAHDVDESLTRAGLRAAARRKLLESSATYDLSDRSVTAEAVAERTGLSRANAEAIISYRDAHEVRTEADLKAAGLDADEAREVMEMVSEGFDPRRMSAEELASKLGISLAKAKTLVEARTANTLGRWNEVSSLLTPTAEGKLRAKFRTLGALNGADRSALIGAGITEGQADKLLNYRDAHDIRSESVLRRVLGYSTGSTAASKIAGFDLSSSSYDRMTELGVDYEAARKIANYRDANLIGRGSEGSVFRADRAADMLSEADVLSYSDAEKLRKATEAVDLTTANKTTLTRRLGMDAAAADKFMAHRDAHKVTLASLKKAGFSEAEAKRIMAEAKEVNLKTASIEEIMARTGLTRAKATKAKALASLNVGSATVAELVRGGVPRANAERIVAFRDKAAEVGGLNYDEMIRKLRLRVRKWVRDSGLSDSLLRSLLPREAERISVVRNVEGEGEGFSSVRRAAPGEFKPSRISYGTVGDVFTSVRNGAVARFNLRFEGAETENERANLTRGKETLDRLGLEIIESNDLIADRAGEKVRLSTGVLNEIDLRAEKLPPAERAAFRSRVLGLILAHEASHAGGLRSEKLADAEAIEVLKGARGIAGALGVDVEVAGREVRAAVDVFERPLGAKHVDSFFSRLRNRFRYGSAGRRISDLERAAAGETVDKLAKWRRADGTLDWKKMGRDGALREGLGTAHFALALFLKELAMVVRTGDRLRIEEFFDGLMTTEFYAHYGMFVIGARAGEVAYVRYLERYIKPRFVNGVLKSNLVLAAGLALPEIVNGTFTGKAFAISLTSLGLASTAVKSGLAGIKWVVNLKKAKNAGTLARTGLAAGRLAKAGAWFYTAAELAVILYIAEDLDHAMNDWLDRRAAGEALAGSSKEFFDAVGDPGATEDSVKEAADAYHEAWSNYRDFLYRPLHDDEAIFAARLEELARKAKLTADKRKATLERVGSRDALRRSIESRYGSLDAYAEKLVKDEEAELNKEVAKIGESFTLNRDKHLKEVYEDHERGDPFLEDVEHMDWLLLGGRDGAAGDPYGDDIFGRIGRRRARAGLEDAIKDVSRNRLEAYDDEAALLDATAKALRNAGREDLATVVERNRDLTRATRAADVRLINGDGTITSAGSDAGISVIEDAVSGEDD